MKAFIAIIKKLPSDFTSIVYRIIKALMQLGIEGKEGLNL